MTGFHGVSLPGCIEDADLARLHFWEMFCSWKELYDVTRVALPFPEYFCGCRQFLNERFIGFGSVKWSNRYDFCGQVSRILPRPFKCQLSPTTFMSSGRQVRGRILRVDCFMNRVVVNLSLMVTVGLRNSCVRCNDWLVEQLAHAVSFWSWQQYPTVARERATDCI